jgi:hypothetical protein
MYLIVATALFALRSICFLLITPVAVSFSLRLPPIIVAKPKARKTWGKDKQMGRPRLFGGTIEEYVKVSAAFVVFVQCLRESDICIPESKKSSSEPFIIILIDVTWEHRQPIILLLFLWLQATGEDIPIVVRSCVRVINLHGKIALFCAGSCFLS